MFEVGAGRQSEQASAALPRRKQRARTDSVGVSGSTLQAARNMPWRGESGAEVATTRGREGSEEKRSGKQEGERGG